MRNEEPDWTKASKQLLLETLLPALEENARLRQSVERLMKRQALPQFLQHAGREDDFVPVGWPERHGIDIPRADGFFESSRAWVRVTHGVITNAGLKNQSVLSVMIARGKLHPMAEKTANQYTDWRAAFFARVEAARYSDTGTGDPEAWSKEDRYSKLIKAVARTCLRCVDIIVTSHPKERDIERLNEGPEVFLDAFQAVAEAMEKINQDAEEALDQAREGVRAS